MKKKQAKKKQKKEHDCVGIDFSVHGNYDIKN